MLTSEALSHSANCFFNSYLRDMGLPFDFNEQKFTINLGKTQLTLPVMEFSQLGAHRFGTQFRLHSEEGFWSIGFLEAAELLCSHSSQDGKLYERLLQSVAVMTASIQSRRTSIEDLYLGNINFLSAEQNLHIGHSFHPSPKSRDEFALSDLERFSPEFGARFQLPWLFVRETLIWEERSRSFDQAPWYLKMFNSEVPEGFRPYPMHPWQWEVLKRDPTIEHYLANGDIREAGLQPQLWSATSSMRSLYNASAPFMLKFSMSVRLTNSIRHMQQKEVSRGMILHDAFNTKAGKEFSRQYPQFRAMHEPLAFSIKDLSGNALPQTMVLLRENPFTESSVEAAVLATLTQDNPIGGENLIHACLAKGLSGQVWFDAFMTNVIQPILMAQANFGIMLGAHQQNLVIELKNGLPIGSYFRDCQGTGFGQLAVESMLSEMPAPEKFLENVLPRESSTDLFTYYFVVNSVMNTISALARASRIPEQAFISSFKAALAQLREHVRDPSIIDHLLCSERLTQKGNFRCSLSGLNENTTPDPLSIYNAFTNPFYEASL